MPARLPGDPLRATTSRRIMGAVDFEAARVVRFASPHVTRRPIDASDGDPEFVYVSIGRDKYSVDPGHEPIDCADRVALCQAACCRLRVPLSREEIDEHVVQWDTARPYLNRQRHDGYCVHCDEATHECAIYEQRPGICRTFDCRSDQRIWIDFERRIPNPKLAGVRKPG